MPTKHADVFAALAKEFDRSEVKTRTQGGRQLRYITARSAMNRLDEVLGAEHWWDDYEPFLGGVKCLLTLVLPDGAKVTKTGVGGITKMGDPSDTEKTGESDAFKRAAMKFGVGRYLYGDGVPELDGDHAPRQRPEPAPAPDGDGRGAPRTGKGLFAWAKEQEQRHDVAVIKYLDQWGKLQDFPARMVDWDADQVALAHAEASRKLAALGNAPTPSDDPAPADGDTWDSWAGVTAAENEADWQLELADARVDEKDRKKNQLCNDFSLTNHLASAAIKAGHIEPSWIAKDGRDGPRDQKRAWAAARWLFKDPAHAAWARQEVVGHIVTKRRELRALLSLPDPEGEAALEEALSN